MIDGLDLAVLMDNNIGIIEDRTVDLRRNQQFDPKFFPVEDIGGGTDEGDVKPPLFKHDVDFVVGGAVDHFRGHPEFPAEILHHLLIIFYRTDRSDHAGNSGPQRFSGHGLPAGRQDDQQDCQGKKPSIFHPDLIRVEHGNMQYSEFCKYRSMPVTR
ncbi:MAG: hypothetical protein ACD_75C00359G0001 [uncultured bacterium]|nr:MAG: hypothetical protein ACD_75C00359G0001 [uncultured bacterium]